MERKENEARETKSKKRTGCFGVQKKIGVWVEQELDSLQETKGEMVQEMGMQEFSLPNTGHMVQDNQLLLCCYVLHIVLCNSKAPSSLPHYSVLPSYIGIQFRETTSIGTNKLTVPDAAFDSPCEPRHNSASFCSHSRKQTGRGGDRFSVGRGKRDDFMILRAHLFKNRWLEATWSYAFINVNSKEKE